MGAWGRGIRSAGAAALALLPGLVLPAAAQDTALPGPGAAPVYGPLATGTVDLQPSPVLTIDQDRLFSASRYGQRVQRDIEAASRLLAAENREIEARLAAEELDLTNRRPTMPAAEFRPLADAFDARVVEIRREQDDKLRALNARPEQERLAFFQAALPVLGDLVRESGAVAILDTRAVFLAADRIDITDTAIARLNATLGDGPVAAPISGTQP